jgi:hypothetical protein
MKTHRPPQRPDAAQDADEADDDRQRQGEDGLRVDEEDVLGVERPAERGERRRDGIARCFSGATWTPRLAAGSWSSRMARK